MLTRRDIKLPSILVSHPPVTLPAPVWYRRWFHPAAPPGSFRRVFPIHRSYISWPSTKHPWRCIRSIERLRSKYTCSWESNVMNTVGLLFFPHAETSSANIAAKMKTSKHASQVVRQSAPRRPISWCSQPCACVWGRGTPQQWWLVGQDAQSSTITVLARLSARQPSLSNISTEFWAGSQSRKVQSDYDWVETELMHLIAWFAKGPNIPEHFQKRFLLDVVYSDGAALIFSRSSKHRAKHWTPGQ